MNLKVLCLSVCLAMLSGCAPAQAEQSSAVSIEEPASQESSLSEEADPLENRIENIVADGVADLGDGWHLVCNNSSFSLYDPQNQKYGNDIRYTNWMSGTLADVRSPLDEDGAVYWLDDASSKVVVMELEHIKIIFHFDGGEFSEERSYTRDMFESLALTSDDGRIEIYYANKVAFAGGGWCEEVALDTQTGEMRFICIGYCDMVFGNGYTLFLHSWNLEGFAIFDALTGEQLAPTIPLSDDYAVHGVAADTKRDLFLAVAATRGGDVIDDPPRSVTLYVFDLDGQLVHEIETSALSKTFEGYSYYEIDMELDGNGYVTIYGSETADTVYYAKP